MAKKLIRLTESELKNIIGKSVMRILKEDGNLVYDEWYGEEDYNGNVGEKGMIRSYNIGTYYDGQAEQDAKENGYDDVAEYLRYWFNEIKPECPWEWTRIGNGYGYHGTTIFKEDGVVCKDIYGQIMIDEYPPMSDI